MGPAASGWGGAGVVRGDLVAGSQPHAGVTGDVFQGLVEVLETEWMAADERVQASAMTLPLSAESA